MVSFNGLIPQHYYGNFNWRFETENDTNGKDTQGKCAKMKRTMILDSLETYFLCEP